MKTVVMILALTLSTSAFAKNEAMMVRNFADDVNLKYYMLVQDHKANEYIRVKGARDYAVVRGLIDLSNKQMKYSGHQSDFDTIEVCRHEFINYSKDWRQYTELLGVRHRTPDQENRMDAARDRMEVDVENWMDCYATWEQDGHVTH